MKRTTALLLTLAMLLALCLAGCGGNASTTEPAAAPAVNEGEAAAAAHAAAAPGDAQLVLQGEPVYGGSATIYYKNFNEVFDPAMAESYTYSLWLESLWGPDWGLNDPSQFNFDANVLPLKYIAGQIADSWDWEKKDDGTSDLHVTIRNDVYFQEKDPAYDVFGARNLMAEDVKFSYDRILDAGEASGEASAEVTNEGFGSYVSYLCKYIAECDDPQFDDGAKEMALGELDTVEIGSDVYAFPFEMIINELKAMTYDEFVKADSGVTSRYDGYVAYLDAYIRENVEADYVEMALGDLYAATEDQAIAEEFPFEMFTGAHGAMSYAQWQAANG